MRWTWIAGIVSASACKFPEPPPVEVDAPPVDAPTECVADTAVCIGDVSRVCDSSGEPLPDTMCWLGCDAAIGRCEQLATSNALDAYMDLARSTATVDLRPSAVIDIASGVITVQGTPVVIGTDEVSPASGGAPIRVFYAASFLIGDVTIAGVEPPEGVSDAIAIVAPGPIVVSGVIDISGNGWVNGPGCLVGAGGQSSMSASDLRGAGGGGFGSDGGNGGLSTVSGQAPQPLLGGPPVGGNTLEPLRGGTSGGILLDLGGFGGAGGALQLSSETSISVTATGGIDAGGAGGVSGGGGSGGAVLLEAPNVQVDSSFVAANGGGGGSRCGSGQGQDGRRDTTRAAGHPGCSAHGRGGDGATNPISPAGNGQPEEIGGSGGGGTGRIMVRTRSGTFLPINGAIVSPPVEVGATRLRDE